jgi:hypothetical protein
MCLHTYRTTIGHAVPPGKERHQKLFDVATGLCRHSLIEGACQCSISSIRTDRSAGLSSSTARLLNTIQVKVRILIETIVLKNSLKDDACMMFNLQVEKRLNQLPAAQIPIPSPWNPIDNANWRPLRMHRPRPHSRTESTRDPPCDLRGEALILRCRGLV